MYVTRSIYQKYATYIDLTDRDFFIECLDKAKDMYQELSEISVDTIKSNTPVCYMSDMSKRTQSESSLIDRKEMNTHRGRRKYLMIDADFDYGQEDQSARLIDSIKKFGEKYATPVMIYPTISYPDKPRFRAVFLVSRALDAKKYWCAIKWLTTELGYDAIDKSDFRITANRNLPMFCNKEQVDATYSTFNNLDLKPLQNKLWSDIEPPETKELSVEEVDAMKHMSYDVDKVLKACDKISKSEFAQNYETFWQLVASIAAAVVLEQLDHDIANEMMEILSTAASNDYLQRRWSENNKAMLTRFISDYQSINQLMKARPLHSYNEFAKSLMIKKGEN